MREIHFVQLKTGGFELLIVAGDAILVENAALRGESGRLGVRNRRAIARNSTQNQNPDHRILPTATQPKAITAV
jgi:hypothetical protein